MKEHASSNRLDRRTFLGAAAATPLLFHIVPDRAFGANERLNIAGIGVGGKGAGEIRDAANEDCNIVALCDVDLRRAKGTIEAFPQAKVYRDFRIMLEERTDIDAVTVSTPDHTHAVAAIMAMRMGKHVYCQKPLTHSVYEARRMAEVAEETGVATQMGNQAHAGEPIRRAAEFIRAGIIGPVHEVHAWTNRPIWPQGVEGKLPAQAIPAEMDWDLWLGPAPYRDFNAGYAPFNWRGWWDFGTGALGDMACHIMDMAFWALELDHPETVQATQLGNTVESPPHNSTVTWQFPARKDQPPVKYVWYDGYLGPDRNSDPQNFPPEEVLEGQNPRSFGSVLVGEKGKFFFNRGSTEWVVTPSTIVEDFDPPSTSLPRVKNEDAEWIAACKGGPAAASNFSYAGPFTEAVLLGNVAIRTGEKIEWDAENLEVTNVSDAAELIRREYRRGWELTM